MSLSGCLWHLKQIMHRNYLHIVSRDDDIEDILDLEFTRLGDRAPIQDVSFKHSSKFETAIRRLKEAPPSIVILDTGWADGDKSAGDILRELRDNNICSPILLIVRRQSLADLQSVVGMACSASNISSWL